MRILVTNDDGIESEGLHALVAKIATLGHDTVVAAPDRDQSGTSASLGRMRADEHIDARRVEIPGCDGVPAFAVVGTPGFCVIAGRLGAFGDRPELVVSGINVGTNTGRAILHSGTVGAALTAQNFGAKGLAVSLESGRSTGDLLDVADLPWHTATEIAGQVLDLLLDAPARTVLNLNVPARPLADVRGIKWAHLDAFGTVRSAIAETPDGRLQFELVATNEEPGADSDRGLLAQGYASVTSVVGVAEAWPDPTIAAPEIAEHAVPGAPVEHVHGPEQSRLALRPHRA
jgi:5'-nucleotidase